MHDKEIWRKTEIRVGMEIIIFPWHYIFLENLLLEEFMKILLPILRWWSIQWPLMEDRAPDDWCGNRTSLRHSIWGKCFYFANQYCWSGIVLMLTKGKGSLKIPDPDLTFTLHKLQKNQGESIVDIFYWLHFMT